MPLHLIDALTRYAGKDPGPTDPGSRPERRQRRRTPVRWRLTLWRGEGPPAIDTITHNLSSSGFYCLCPIPLTPGETVRCSFRVPAHDPHDEERHIDMECRALVVRAEAAPDGFFGIACHIEEYHVGNGHSDAR